MAVTINADTSNGVIITPDTSGEIEFQADGFTIATITGSGMDIPNGLTFGSPIDIASGGTGQTTATASFNALAPSQTGNSGKYLTTNGTNTSWGTVTVPTLTSDLTNDSGFITGNQTITLSGDATGSGTTSIVVTVADDSHNHIISNVDGLQTALDAKSNLSGATFSGLITGSSSASTDVNTANDTGSISIRGSASTVASMSFHRTGAYAINMGLGTDNVFRIGGWSASNNCLQLTGTGNLTTLGSVTATSFSGDGSALTGIAGGKVTKCTQAFLSNSSTSGGTQRTLSGTDFRYTDNGIIKGQFTKNSSSTLLIVQGHISWRNTSGGCHGTYTWVGTDTTGANTQRYHHALDPYRQNGNMGNHTFTAIFSGLAAGTYYALHGSGRGDTNSTTNVINHNPKNYNSDTPNENGRSHILVYEVEV